MIGVAAASFRTSAGPRRPGTGTRSKPWYAAGGRSRCALVRNPKRAPRIVDGRSAALWPLHDGPAADGLLSLTVQGLAALKLPHLLFEAVLDRLGL